MANCGTWKSVVWERANKTGKWSTYSPEVSQLLEQSYQKNLIAVCLGDADVSLKIYSVNLKDMIQTSEVTGTKVAIRRCLCNDLDLLNKGYIWQWCGNDRGDKSWHSYDVDVNNFIEKAFVEGIKCINLHKKFHNYNYEIDFVNMLQVNKKSKRKRAIRRVQSGVPYPIAKCPDNVIVGKESSSTDVINGNQDILYSNLAQEVPGTTELLVQVNDYMKNVSQDLAVQSPSDKLSASFHSERKDDCQYEQYDAVANSNQKGTESLHSEPHANTGPPVALVNGRPWRRSRPPDTPQSKLKPVPGIDPLPKPSKRSKSAKKMKGASVTKGNGTVSVLKEYVEKVEIIPTNSQEERACIICFENLSCGSSYNGDSTVVKLALCSHMFHEACLEAMLNSGSKDNHLQCPTCKKIYGEKCGMQPPGHMVYHVLPYSLPGFYECDTIRIIYDIKSGIQGPEHPNPGKSYTARGFPRHCFLPDNEMGRKILRLLIKAWQRRLIFTIGRSSTTGEENTVTWNEIHHKTEFGENYRGHGYPDPNYFANVLAELEAHGVTDDVYLWYPA